MTLAERLFDLNRWYEALPDGQRILVYPAVLVAAGLINTRWTGSPFGAVLLLTVLALIAVRRSYTSGWLGSRVAAGGPLPDARYRAAAAPVVAGPRTIEAVAVAEPAPVEPVGVVVEPAVSAAALPVAPVEAAVPASPAAQTGRARRGNGSAARKTEGRSGRRKPSGRRPDAEPS
jgi:hypothetical protein